MAHRVWIWQLSRDKGKRGAPWYCSWYEGSKRRSKKIGSKKAAREYQANLESALNNDEFSGRVRARWEDVREEYEAEHMAARAASTRTQSRIALDHAERILSPATVTDLDRAALSRYAAARLEESHNEKLISPATVNKELRQLRAFLRECTRRKYLLRSPEIPFVREPERLPTYISPEQFGKLYEACDKMTEPADQGYSAADWWRAYLTWLYLTGWRAGEPLSITKEDLDFENGRVMLRAESNKGRRDELVPLHPVIFEHLEPIRAFGPMVLPWELPRRKLWDLFHALQDHAKLKRRRDGRRYGFHDLRRGFASMNADRMTADALQAIMRHRDYGTTQRYINIARQLNPAAQAIYVPAAIEKAGRA